MRTRFGDIGTSEIIPPVGYMSNRLLVATPLITAPAFSRSVILMFNHNAEGAMGIIVNHVIENLNYQELFDQLSINTPPDSNLRLPVHYGGPVEINRGFVVYRFDDLPHVDTLFTAGDVGVSSSVGFLRDIAAGNGPKECILALGYAAWGPGQLESEMEANSWISVPAMPELVFEKDNSIKWKRAAESQGIDISRLTSPVGHA